MSLFINTGHHPGVFKNKNDITGKNQSYYRRDHFSDLLKEQQDVNHTLIQSLREIKRLNQEQTIRQEGHRKDLAAQLRGLEEQNKERKRFENKTLDSLYQLGMENAQLQKGLEADERIKQEMLEKITSISESNSRTEVSLYNQVSFNKQVIDQLKEVIEMQTQMNTDASQNNKQHDQLVNRLETQEALMEKTLRQLNHLRASLFERTHHLVEKMEETYDLTTSYVNQLLSGSNKPLTFFMTEEQKKESKSDSSS